MPASLKHLTDKKSNLTSLLARWKDGLYYTAAVVRCDKVNKRCLVCFEDGSEVWVTNRDVHLQLSPEQLNEEEDIVCCMCDDGSSEPPNEIILCDVCQQGYHQKCHIPPVDSSKIDESEETSDHKDWFCATCSYILNQSDPNKLSGTSSQQQQPQQSKSQTNNQSQKQQEQPSQSNSRNSTSKSSPQSASNSASRQNLKRPPPSPKATQHLEPKVKARPKQVESQDRHNNQPSRQQSQSQLKPQAQSSPQQPQQPATSTTSSPSPQQTKSLPVATVNPATVIRPSPNTTPQSPVAEVQDTQASVQLQALTPTKCPNVKIISKASSSSITSPSQQNQIKTTVICPLVKVASPSVSPGIGSPTNAVTRAAPGTVTAVNNNLIIQAKAAPYYPLSNQVRVAATSSTAALASLTASSALVVGSSTGRTKQDIVNLSSRSNQNRQRGSPSHPESVISVATSTQASQPPVKNAVRKSSVNFVMPPVRQSALPTATRSIPSVVNPTTVSASRAGATVATATTTTAHDITPSKTNLIGIHSTGTTPTASSICSTTTLNKSSIGGVSTSDREDHPLELSRDALIKTSSRNSE